MPSPVETVAFVETLQKHFPRLAGESFTRNTTGEPWWNAFMLATEQAHGLTDVAFEPADADWPTAAETLRVAAHKANKLGKQRLERNKAKKLLKGLDRGASDAACFKASVITALRLAFAAEAVYEAIQAKLPGCLKHDEIAGDDRHDLWDERGSHVDARQYGSDKKALLEAVASRDLDAVCAIVSGWEPIDC